MKLKLKAWLAAAAAAFSVSAGADILPTGLQPYEFVFEKFASTDFIAGFQNCVSHTAGKVSLFERCARQVRKVLEERYQAAYDEASSRCGASQECRSALAESFQYYEIYRSQMKNYLSLALDPESLIGQRVANGFEFYDLQKQTVLLDMISSGKTPGDAAFPSIKIGLEWDTPRLYERINRRVDLMMEQGLVAEVEGLLKQGFREGLTAPAAIGYKEVVAALDGECSMDEAAEQIKLATRRYSKRQRSWLRGEAGLVGLRAQDKPLEQLLDESLQLIAAARQAVK